MLSEFESSLLDFRLPPVQKDEDLCDTRFWISKLLSLPMGPVLASACLNRPRPSNDSKQCLALIPLVNAVRIVKTFSQDEIQDLYLITVSLLHLFLQVRRIHAEARKIVRLP